MKNFIPKIFPNPFKIFLFIVIIFLGYLAVLLVFHNYKLRNYVTGFSRIEAGMSKKSVIELLGDPAEIADCNLTVVIQKDRNCDKVFWYRVTLERWGIYFDEQDKVVDKIHNVSY